jgi:hypothetical protein
MNALSGYAAQKKPAENHATIGNEFNIRRQLHAIRSGLSTEELTLELRRSMR